eukprot:m.37858 g.37858  ORF g.37858 m.37858 type:complete len:274 (+) comp6764_c0_seq8:345-1166(+)
MHKGLPARPDLVECVSYMSSTIFLFWLLFFQPIHSNFSICSNFRQSSAKRNGKNDLLPFSKNRKNPKQPTNNTSAKSNLTGNNSNSNTIANTNTSTSTNSNSNSNSNYIGNNSRDKPSTKPGSHKLDFLNNREKKANKLFSSVTRTTTPTEAVRDNTPNLLKDDSFLKKPSSKYSSTSSKLFPWETKTNSRGTGDGNTTAISNNNSNSNHNHNSSSSNDVDFLHSEGNKQQGSKFKTPSKLPWLTAQNRGGPSTTKTSSSFLDDDDGIESIPI